MTTLSCSAAIEQLDGSALAFSTSSVAAAVGLEVCARATFSRLAQSGRMGADGRCCTLVDQTDIAEVLVEPVARLCRAAAPS